MNFIARLTWGSAASPAAPRVENHDEFQMIEANAEEPSDSSTADYLLKGKGFLTQKHLIDIINFFKKKVSDRFDAILEPMTHPVTNPINELASPSYQLRKYLEDHPLDEVRQRLDFIFIPFIFPGIIKHIVLITIDFKENSVDYYDSKGIISADRIFERFDMHQELQLIREMCFGRAGSIAENMQKHQTDRSNCGLYVADFLQRRLGGETFHTICSQGKDAAAIVNFGREMAPQL